MKFVIHGMTSLSNFGDVLFAQLFFEETVKSGDQAFFFNWPRIGIGNHLAEYLQINDKGSVFSFMKADAFVLMSGGYFGINPTTGTAINEIKILLRYLIPACLFMMTRKPLYIMGVGGGPLNTRIVRRIACWLMERASLVYVRDQETKDYFVSYGVKREIQVTADTALLLGTKRGRYSPTISSPYWKTTSTKIIFIHLTFNRKETEQFIGKIAASVNAFIERHPEYGIAVGFDHIMSDTENADLTALAQLAFETDKIFGFVYRNPKNLCEMLMASDLIITPKLHVGIVGAAFSKSVLSCPIHAEKIHRFYKQIGESGRCRPLCEITQGDVLQMLNTYHDRPIIIPQELKQAAERNFDFLNAGNRK